MRTQTPQRRKPPAGRGTGGRRPGGSSGGRFSSSRGGGRSGGRFFQKKVCRLCPETEEVLNYRNVDLLKRYLTEKGKILPRRITGNCAKCQRWVTRVIKRSRHAALIAFQVES